MANLNFGTFNRPGTIADQATFDIGLRTHMVRVYNYMAAGLALSGIVAFGLFSSAELASLFFEVQAGRVVGMNMLGWIAIFAPLGLLMLTSFRAARMSVTAVQAVYWAVTALMGVSLSLLHAGCLGWGADGHRSAPARGGFLPALFRDGSRRGGRAACTIGLDRRRVELPHHPLSLGCPWNRRVGAVGQRDRLAAGAAANRGIRWSADRWLGLLH
jgi:hypothetical protein